MSRLPNPGSDDGTWGSILNDFLAQVHNTDGSLKAGSVGSGAIAPNAVSSSSIANGSITAAHLADATISEAKLDSTVQTKLNATAGTPDWSTISNKPTVIAAGADAATAKSVLSLTSTDVGLGNVNNTSDANKPISTATQTALSGKAPTVHTHASTDISDSTSVGRSLLTAADAPTARTAIGAVTIGTTNATAKAGDYAPASIDISDSTAVGRSLITAASAAAAKSVMSLSKADVGLGNVDNTSDLNKPISTAAQTALDAKADLVGGVVPTSQLPAVSMNTAVTVANQAAMLALTSAQVQPGDMAIRTDGAGTFILIGADPSQLANWTLLDSPTAPVTSVNSQTGTVVLGKTDVGLGNIDNTSDINKPISTATQTALNAKADLVGGLIPNNQLPPLAITNVVTVASQAAMLALTSTQVQQGDVAVRTDGAGSFILTASDPSQIGNWTLLQSPTDAVTSVNGHTGAVTLVKSDVGLGNVDNTSDVNKPISAATSTALSGKAPTTRAINTTNSLTGGGDLSADRTLSLVGDNATPGNSKYYGTDGTGTKGFFGLPASGEVNTASNVGIGGVGVYKQKTGVNLEFKNIAAGSTKVTVTDDTANSQVDIDVNPANFTGIPESAVTNLTTDLNAKASTATTVTGTTSLTGGGDLSANRTLTLVNDSAAPGSSQYYGTDGSGTKGYHGLPASGDASTNTSISVDSEVVLFNGTTGKSLKRANVTGIAKLSSGVLSAVTAPVGNIVGDTDSQILSSKTLSNPTVTNYTETLYAIGTVGSSGYTISLTNGTLQTATLTAAQATTFTLPAPAAGKSFVLMVSQPAGGTGTATFSSPSGSMKWNSAGAPTITATVSKTDILSFFSEGTNWYGSYSQGY